MKHYCHAKDCKVEVPERLFMCKKHWKKVPQAVKRAILAEYVPGQEITKTPTIEYINVTTRAIAIVAGMEGKLHPKAAVEDQDRLFP